MKKRAIVYWSGTGNTEIMAEAIAQSLENQGQTFDYEFVKSADISRIKDYDQFFLGSPAMTAEMIEEREFRPFFDELKPYLASKEVFLFGSYDWGDGLWMENWQKEVEAAGAKFLGKFIAQWDPSEQELASLQADVKKILDM